MAIETRTKEVVSAVELTSVSCGLMSDGEWVWFDHNVADDTEDKIRYDTFKNVIESFVDADSGIFEKGKWTIKRGTQEFSIRTKEAHRVVCYEYSNETDGLKEFFEAVEKRFDV